MHAEAFTRIARLHTRNCGESQSEKAWIFYERDKIRPEYPSSWKSKIYEIHIVINHNVFLKGLFLMQMKSIRSLANTSNWIWHAIAVKSFTWSMSHTVGLTILHAHVVIQLKDVGQRLHQKYSENGVGEKDAHVRLKRRILYSEILASEHFCIFGSLLFYFIYMFLLFFWVAKKTRFKRKQAGI